MERHPLFDELEAWNPRWQKQCATIRAAARLAGAMREYADWIKTPDGVRYLEAMAAVSSPSREVPLLIDGTADDAYRSLENDYD